MFEMGSSQCCGAGGFQIRVEIETVQGDWRHGVDPQHLEAKDFSEDRGHKYGCLCRSKWNIPTGVTTRVAELRKAIRSRTASRVAARRHDFLSWIDHFRLDDGALTLRSDAFKGLMLPPGLGFDAISKKALNSFKSARLRRHIRD